MKQKILMIFCGGTIAMLPDEETGTLKPAKTSEELLELIPRVKNLVELDVIELFNVDSTNITVEHWVKIIDTIYEKYDDYEGFLITHGTDTMVDTGSALALAFGKSLGKPIVLTGSQAHFGAVGTDAKFNLENAFRVVIEGKPEVTISFGHSILRAIRAEKRHDSDFNAFHSPNFPQLGFIRSSIFWNPVVKREQLNSPTLFLQKDFEQGILNVKVNAGLDPNIIENMIKANSIKGIILESLGAGNIPSSYLEPIRKAVKANIPVLISSPFSEGGTHASMYELGYEAIQAGAIETYDMTSTSIYVKLMWCLAQINKKIQLNALSEDDKMLVLREMFKTNYVGEVSID